MKSRQDKKYLIIKSPLFPFLHYSNEISHVKEMIKKKKVIIIIRANVVTRLERAREREGERERDKKNRKKNSTPQSR